MTIVFKGVRVGEHDLKKAEVLFQLLEKIISEKHVANISRQSFQKKKWCLRNMLVLAIKLFRIARQGFVATHHKTLELRRFDQINPNFISNHHCLR